MRNTRKLLKSFTGLTSVAFLCGLSGAASAQAQLETVTVTAEKTATNSQDTANVITTVSGSDLSDRAIVNIRDVQFLSPSFVVNDTGGTASPLYLRGVGLSYNAPANQPEVAVNLDGAPMTLYSLPSFYDLERVELLYGPQGTLYGGDDTAGVLNIITKGPTDDYGGYGSFEYGNYQLMHFNGAINIPLDDTLKVRIAGNFVNRHGYVHSHMPGDTGQNADQSAAERASILWTPTTQLTVKAKIESWQGGGATDTGVPYPFINPSNPWYTPLSQSQWGSYQASQFTQSVIDVSYKFDNGLLLEDIPSYLYSLTNYKITAGGVDAFNGQTQVPTTDERLYYIPWHQLSNELRLGQTTSNYRWLAGFIWFDGNTNDDPGIVYTAYPGIIGQPLRRVAVQGGNFTDSRYYAIFAQGTYNVSDDFRVTGGLRFSHDRKKQNVQDNYTDSYNTNGQLVSHVINGPSVPTVSADGNDVVDYKLGLEYNPADDVLLYATVSTGFVGSSLNPYPSVGASPNYGPEHLMDLSGGIKSEWFNHRLRINVEGYDYIYHGLQVTATQTNFTTGAIVTESVNVPKVINYGLDLDTTYLITDSTELNAKIGFIPDDHIVALQTSSGSYAGFRLPNAPNTSAILGLAQTFDFSNGASLRAAVNAQLSAGYWTSYQHLAFVSNFTKVDFNLTYTPESAKWRLDFWGKNLTDAISVAGQTTPGATVVLNPPRTFGVNWTANF